MERGVSCGWLDLGNIEHFGDVLLGDHKRVDPQGVEGAVITASCVDYSTMGGGAGLEGLSGWQIVDAPRVLLHFRELLVTLVENVFGWVTANEGQSFAFYKTAMQRLRHTVWELQRLSSRHLGMAIQSERAFVFSNRQELDGHLGPPTRLDEILVRRYRCATSCCLFQRCSSAAQSARCTWRRVLGNRR